MDRMIRNICAAADREARRCGSRLLWAAHRQDGTGTIRLRLKRIAVYPQRRGR